MNFLKTFSIIFFVVICCLPAKLFAGSYSDLKNHKIWELRLAAARHASQEASKKCAWKPKSPTVPADQFRPNQHVSKKKLFLKIMAMLRLDQNARDLSTAFGDDKNYDRVEEVDANNFAALKHIVSTFGFPSVDEVGEVGANAMLMLVAHADQNLEFQKSTLQKMDEEVAKGKLPAVYPAMLKAIRPKIVGSSRISGNESSSGEYSNTRPASYSSGPKCYHRSYNKIFYSYIRNRYKKPD